MAEVMTFNQEKYVPCLTTGDKKEVVTPIAFHGDQLFEERARNVQWTYRDADTTYDQIRGLRTEFADWHAKVTLYKVSPTKKDHKYCYCYVLTFLPTDVIN